MGRGRPYSRPVIFFKKKTTTSHDVDENADESEVFLQFLPELFQGLRDRCFDRFLTDTQSFGNMNDRSWVFRTVGYGSDLKIWKDMISTLRQIGYDGAISIEHEDGLMSPREGLEKAIAFLKDIIIREQPSAMWWS